MFFLQKSGFHQDIHPTRSPEVQGVEQQREVPRGGDGQVHHRGRWGDQQRPVNLRRLERHQARRRDRPGSGRQPLHHLHHPPPARRVPRESHRGQAPLAGLQARPSSQEMWRLKELKFMALVGKVPRMPKPTSCPYIYPSRTLRGMKRCEDNCTSCPYIIEAKRIKNYGISWFINKKINCKSYNLVYAIICKKENCKLAYIGYIAI